MLNGLDPIIIFNFKKLLPALQGATSGIPLLAGLTDSLPLAPIPIYLSEKITGLYIEQENKNIDIATDAVTKDDGKKPSAFQQGLGSTVTVVMHANASSIGLTILSALTDIIFEKVTSQEYTISYLHKAVAIFGGLLDSFSIQQSRDNDLYTATMVISRVTGGTTIPEASPDVASKTTGTVPNTGVPLK